MPTKSALLRRIQQYVTALESDNNCFVPSKDIQPFVAVCDALGIHINGGALTFNDNSVLGQYFYI